MDRYDFTAHRLFVDFPLFGGARVDLDRNQTNYLCNVLRLADGASVIVFNGKDGEWRAVLTAAARKTIALVAVDMTRPQPAGGDLHYLFAPLKHARIDYMVQKAVEMGASRLQPVITRRTQATRLNTERMRANAIEAAEQCGILAIPEIAPQASLAALLATWDAARVLVFCDEDAPRATPVETLRATEATAFALLIGPEGGFDPAERDGLLALPNVVRISLGPRILRADTAAVAALALLQAVRGDWYGSE